MRRTEAYILETARRYPHDQHASFQVIDQSNGRHVSPFFATLLEAIEFFDHNNNLRWNGHIEVRHHNPAGMA